MQKPTNENRRTDRKESTAKSEFGSPSKTEKNISGQKRKSDRAQTAQTEPAVQADQAAADAALLEESSRRRNVNRNEESVEAILAEVDAKRRPDSAKPDADDSFAEGDADPQRDSLPDKLDPEPEDTEEDALADAERMDTDVRGKKQEQTAGETGEELAAQNKKQKKKPNTFVSVLQGFIPWRGDTPLVAVRKIVFFAALCVVGVCTFLICDYYVGLSRDRKAYEDLQARLQETLDNRHFSQNSGDEAIEVGDKIDYFEMNDMANLLLPQNPDLVGYVKIDGTEVSYPIVQRKSSDPNENTNDYYLYRNFYQEDSKSGSIFLDFRCHLDEVVDHRRTVENSGNLVVYGHNMNNRSMFGSLKDYIRNYSFLKEHPIVHLQSLYQDYDFKIFAIFVVDSSDLTSEYAFDCWNTLDFADEDAFYDYVNKAKMRNIIANDVDVKYGDQLLTLYTCTSFVSDGKLIVMARELRDGEDPNAGVENSGHNDNILYPKSYYRNHKETFDPERFVPYGP